MRNKNALAGRCHGGSHHLIRWDPLCAVMMVLAAIALLLGTDGHMIRQWKYQRQGWRHLGVTKIPHLQGVSLSWMM